MEVDEAGAPRTRGVNPAARRLQLGMSAIVGRPDGALVELFPDGTEVVLHGPKERAESFDPNPADDLSGKDA